SPSTALITTKTPATIRNAAQYGSPSASSPVAAANSSITHAESRRNSSTAAQAAMMPALTARAVISFFAMSISCWTTPRRASRNGGRGRGHGAGRVREPGDAFGEELGRRRAQPIGVRVGAGELCDAGGGQRGVAVAGHGELLRDGESGVPRGGEDAHRGDVVRAGDGRGDAAAAQQHGPGGLPDLLGEVAGLDPGGLPEAVAPHRRAERVGPLPGDGRTDPADMCDLAVPEADEVIYQEALTDLVVDADGVEAAGEALRAADAD